MLEQDGDHSAVCLVQFQGVPVNQLPTVFLATPHEIAAKLKSAAGSNGSKVLYLDYTRTRGANAGVRDFVPAEWLMTRERILQLVDSIGLAPR